MLKQRLIINAGMSIAQTIVLGAIAILLYGYLLKTIGVEALGIWSLLLATTAATRIADLGLSASVVKFAAKYIARGEDNTVIGIIQTAVVSVGALTGLIVMIGYPLVARLLALIMPSPAFESARSLLPYALLSLWMAVMASVFLSGLDGHQRIDLRSWVLICGAAIHLLLSYGLVPSYGLKGLAFAEVVQAFFVLITSWILLRRHHPSLPLVPHRWDRRLFGEMLGYSINFQIVSIVAALYEPLTKGLLTHFGGLALAGYYEMANRIVLQLRNLVVSANQVVVPAIAHLQEKLPGDIQVVYKESFRILIYLALPIFSVTVAAMPIVSEIWIGHFERVFVSCGILLSAGFLINSLAAPAYFTNLGTGDLRWNTLGHVAIGLLNVGLGFMLGIYYGGMGGVVAWTISLAFGSGLIIAAYHRKHGIPLREVFSMWNGSVALACGTALFAALIIYYKFRPIWGLPTVANWTMILTVSILAVPVWIDPTRKRLTGWIARDFLNTY